MNAINDYMLFDILSNLPNEWLFKCMRVNKQFNRVIRSIMRPRWFECNFDMGYRRVHYFIGPGASSSLECPLEYVSRLFNGIIYKNYMRTYFIRGCNNSLLKKVRVPNGDICLLRNFRFIELKHVTIEDYMMPAFCDCEILKIRHAVISDAGLKMLLNCVELDISYSNVTNEGLRNLASLGSLRYLKANYCPYITSEALTYFPANVKIEMRKAPADLSLV